MKNMVLILHSLHFGKWFKLLFKLSRMSVPSEGGQNKTPGNLVRVLGWRGLSIRGQVCLLSGPAEGNCIWFLAQFIAQGRWIIWTPVFSYPNCYSTHQCNQSNRHNFITDQGNSWSVMKLGNFKHDVWWSHILSQEIRIRLCASYFTVWRLPIKSHISHTV